MSPGLACLLLACALVLGNGLPPRHLAFLTSAAIEQCATRAAS